MPSGVYPRLSLEERFWRKVKKMPSGCWEWIGSKDGDGYGHLWARFPKWIKASRFSFILAGKKIPEGFELDHLCRNRGCVNPEYLEAVIHKENCIRGEVGIKSGLIQKSKTHCPQGHPYNKQNTYIRPDGTGRGCKTCIKERNKIYSKRRD